MTRAAICGPSNYAFKQTLAGRVTYCVIVGSIFDANQQNKTRLVNLLYYRQVITIAELKTLAPCEYVNFISRLQRDRKSRPINSITIVSRY